MSTIATKSNQPRRSRRSKGKELSVFSEKSMAPKAAVFEPRRAGMPEAADELTEAIINEVNTLKRQVQSLSDQMKANTADLPDETYALSVIYPDRYQSKGPSDQLKSTSLQQLQLMTGLTTLASRGGLIWFPGLDGVYPIQEIGGVLQIVPTPLTWSMVNGLASVSSSVKLISGLLSAYSNQISATQNQTRGTITMAQVSQIDKIKDLTPSNLINLALSKETICTASIENGACVRLLPQWKNDFRLPYNRSTYTDVDIVRPVAQFADFATPNTVTQWGEFNKENLVPPVAMGPVCITGTVIFASSLTTSKYVNVKIKRYGVAEKVIPIHVLANAWSCPIRAYDDDVGDIEYIRMGWDNATNGLAITTVPGGMTFEFTNAAGDAVQPCIIGLWEGMDANSDVRINCYANYEVIADRETSALIKGTLDRPSAVSVEQARIWFTESRVRWALSWKDYLDEHDQQPHAASFRKTVKSVKNGLAKVPGVLAEIGGAAKTAAKIASLF